MSEKSDYTAEEWDLLQNAMLEAGAVMMALHPGGMIRESLAVFKALDEAFEEYADNPLIIELIDVDQEESGSVEEKPEGDSPESNGDIETNKQSALQMLNQAVAILQTKGTPREVEAYREVVVGIAVKTAAATKSGGFLGLGGQRIDTQELQLIGEIKEALGFID